MESLSEAQLGVLISNFFLLGLLLGVGSGMFSKVGSTQHQIIAAKTTYGMYKKGR